MSTTIYIILVVVAIAIARYVESKFENLDESIEGLKGEIRRIQHHFGIIGTETDDPSNSYFGSSLDIEYVRKLKKGATIELNIGSFQFDHIESERSENGYKVFGSIKGSNGNSIPMEFYVGTRQASSPGKLITRRG